MGWRDATELITIAVGSSIRNKKVTIDFHKLMENATLLKTSEFADEVIKTPIKYIKLLDNRFTSNFDFISKFAV
jgi:hypothetical protein